MVKFSSYIPEIFKTPEMGPSNFTSNNSDLDALLQELNDQMALSMIPVMVYLCSLLVFGFLGNGMVIYYYGRKTKRTSNSVFICVVAAYDLTSCCVSIPIEIVDLRYFYMFSNSGACKILRFVNHISALGSAFTLLVIAGDRFRRICKPFKTQLSLGNTKLVGLLTFVIAVFFSSPALIFYTSVKSELINEDGVKLQGCDCTTTRENSYKTYLWIFNGVYAVLFVTATIILCTIYSIIGKVLYRHNRFRKRYSSKSGERQINQETLKTAKKKESVKKQINSDKEIKGIDLDNKNNEVTHNIPNTTFSLKPKRFLELSKHDKNSSEQLDIKTVKYTIIMLVITVVFILSFLPFLCLSIWELFQDDFRAYDSSVGFQIGIRSYFLNSALNPLAYGFFNSKFRNFFFQKFCPCCQATPEKTSQSSSSAC